MNKTNNWINLLKCNQIKINVQQNIAFSFYQKMLHETVYINDNKK